MSGIHAVRTDDGAYAVAVAELPRSTRRSAATEGSIVVIGGHAGWGARLRRAVDDGAVAIVLSQPKGIDANEFRNATDAAHSVPVIVDRSRLRRDVVIDATPRASPRAVQVECAATSADLDAVLRDAIGWARVLAGGTLELRAARVTPRAVMLQLERNPGLESPIPVSVLLGRRDSAVTWMRALAIDSVRTEVTLQHPVGSPTVDRADRNGHAQSPPRYESSERFSLTRVLGALEHGDRPTDLDELERDSAIAARALA